jgi:DNA-binding transcriptional LysR family regulator
MDLDIAQVRAFLAAAEEQHFGRAAEKMQLTQQALSKRISRLEAGLGVLLFLRHGHAVQLTDAGARFRQPAREAVSAADRAIAAVTEVRRPLRLDVWGHLYQPMRTVRPVFDNLPGVELEVGPSRDLPSALAALDRGEIDVAFGRLSNLGDGRHDYTHRLVRLEPVDVVVSGGHPLAGREQLRPDDLRDSVLWCPAAVERLEFLHRFAEQFGIPAESGSANLGLDQLLQDLREDQRRFSLLPADMEMPPTDGIVAIALTDPAPLYAWSLLWRTHERHPALDTVLHAFAETGAKRRWLEYRPTLDWLPRTDPALPAPLPDDGDG